MLKRNAKVPFEILLEIIKMHRHEEYLTNSSTIDQIFQNISDKPSKEKHYKIRKRL